MLLLLLVCTLIVERVLLCTSWPTIRPLIHGLVVKMVPGRGDILLLILRMLLLLWWCMREKGRRLLLLLVVLVLLLLL